MAPPLFQEGLRGAEHDVSEFRRGKPDCRPNSWAVDFMAKFLEIQLGLDSTSALIAAILVHGVLLISLFGAAPLLFIWLERKVSGRIQDRLGPTRVGGAFGWLQCLADGIKLIQKEDLCPGTADSMLFRAAPYLVAVSSFCALIALPFSDGWVARSLDVGLFFMFAVMSLEVIGVILAGYSSGSKWSLFGGMREAAQVVSYEIPMAICALVPVMTAGTLNLVDLGRVQGGWFTNWLIFANPFTFLAFFIYFTVATASVKRAPFDLAEAESELVAGFHTEYSGIRWSYFFMAEYSSMFTVGGLACYLFLGGWHIGIPLPAGLDGGFQPSWDASGNYTGSGIGPLIGNLIGLVVFLFKAIMLVNVQIWVRWTLPRLRIDQVMMACLKYLVPISCFLFLGAAVWPLALRGMSGSTSIPSLDQRTMAEKLYRKSETVQAQKPQPAEKSEKHEAAPHAEIEKHSRAEPIEASSAVALTDRPSGANAETGGGHE